VDPVQQLALVSEAEQISQSELSRASAALQKQLTRDFNPIWGVNATIDAFAALEDVPLTYWPVLVQTDIHVDAAGVHEDKNGQPFALVQYSNAWTLTASHEMLEMCADPFGRRLIQSQSLKEDQGRVEYLVEVCDPCEAAEFGYQVNGVLVSDFYTPHYFDPASTASDAVRYSLTGAVKQPREVLRGGYLSWHDPVSDHWWQSIWFSGDRPTFRDLGPLDAGRGSLRAQVDRLTPVPALVEGLPEHSDVLTRAASGSSEIDRAAAARAEALRSEIDEIRFAAEGSE
jgi:hypothetical protein